MGSFALAFFELLLSSATCSGIILAARMLIGPVYGMQVPLGQSIVAGCTSSTERGFFFGTLMSCYWGGVLTYGVFTTSISNVQLSMGAGILVQGWRLAVLGVGLLNLLVSAAFKVYMQDLPRLAGADKGGQASLWQLVLEELMTAWSCLGNTTFKILLMRGGVAYMVLSALSFGTMYFQYCGFSDFEAANVVASMTLGTAFGTILGGRVTDQLAGWSRFHGRALSTQLSTGVGLSMFYVIFTSYPSSFSHLCFLGFFFGLLGSWAASAIVRPMVTEIFEPALWESALGCLYIVEISFGCLCGAPSVSYLLEHVFGYRESRLLVGQMPAEMRESNRRALSSSLLVCCMTSFIVGLCLDSLLHVTFRNDAHFREAEGEQKPLSNSAKKSLA